ncbi:MAG: L-threonine 3-dehydrogenase [Phycisphaerae bacterium]|nr:L-threonine 3-dehydrogenase [Phycisphaerae bacterium]
MKAIWLNFSLPRMAWTRMAGRMNRRAFWGLLSPLKFGQRPMPELPGDDWVRCRTIMGGICGSDVASVCLRQSPDTILRPHVSYPMFLGHENLAEVVDVGPAVDAAWAGKRVSVEPSLNCKVRGVDPPCRTCAEGKIGACENFSREDPLLPAGVSIGYNWRTGGSWSEYFVAHQWQLFEVPDSIPDEDAILTDPLGCALHGVLAGQPKNDELILVVGAGIIGLGVVAGLRALGCEARIIIDTRHEFQADAAVRLGANQAVSTGRPGSADRYERLAELSGARVARGMFGARVLAGGFDLVFDCVGTSRTLQDSLRVVRGGGRVVLLGTNNARKVDWTSVWFREVRVLGVNGRKIEKLDGEEINSYALAHRLMAQGKLKCNGLLTHTYRLEDYKQALADATDKRSSGLIKAAFTFKEAAGS